MCVNIIYVCICLYCVICLILYYRSLLICTNKEFMKYYLILYTMSLAIKQERVNFLKRIYDTSMGTCIFK